MHLVSIVPKDALAPDGVTASSGTAYMYLLGKLDTFNLEHIWPLNELESVFVDQTTLFKTAREIPQILPTLCV